MPKTIRHLIIGLGKGGAETALYYLLKYRTQDNNTIHSVISMGEGNYYVEKIRSLGIDVLELDLRHKPVSTLIKIREMSKNTDILCSWMYHANFIGYMSSIGKKNKIVWNIRHSNTKRANESFSSWAVMRLCALFSRKVDAIVYNGNKAKTNHEAVGYNNKHSMVLDNGCDLKEFSYIQSARDSIIEEFNIPDDSKIILSVARYNPIKDIPTFIKAFSLIKKEIPKAVAMMCGNGINKDNAELLKIIEENHLVIDKDVILCDQRDDLPRFFSAADLYILHSKSEAFPNTLIQAMATSCLCVSTDVGDVNLIFEKNDYVVPVKDAESISNKAINLLTKSSDEKELIGRENRKTVLQKYDITKIVKEYENLF